MSLNDDLTSRMPAYLQSKLEWAGAYADEETDGEVYCNAAWSKDASAQDCAEADAIFFDAYPDLARINHTGHCPEDICGEPNWLK